MVAIKQMHIILIELTFVNKVLQNRGLLLKLKYGGK